METAQHVYKVDPYNPLSNFEYILPDEVRENLTLRLASIPQDIDYISKEMQAQQIHDDVFNIRDIKDPRPLSSVLINPECSPYFNKPREELISRLLRLKIPELTHMSITDLLKLPKADLKCIIKATVELAATDQSTLDRITKTK